MSVVDFSLVGKVAIVTGGSRGIGRSIAIALAEAGADVAVAARNPDALAEAVAAIAATGRKGIGVPTDIGSLQSLENLVAETKKQLGRVDVLVNNAASIPSFEPFADVDEESFDKVMDLNVKACFFLSKLTREAILEHDDGGSIINVSSTAGVHALAGMGMHSISKAALNMLTQVCAKEWGRDGIRVNCIAPGLIKTETSRPSWENERFLKHAQGLSPLNRIGEPDEMAGAVVYLASPASSFVTGQTLLLDGGSSA